MANFVPPLFRGLTDPLLSDGDLAFIRSDRRPRNTSLFFNILFNLMVERKFGIPNIRRHALFVTGDIRRALPYAKAKDSEYLCTIQPVGEFRYLYSPYIHDSYALDDEFSDEYLACFFPWNGGKAFSVGFIDALITLDGLQRILAQPETDHPTEGWSPSTLENRLYSAMDRLVEKYQYRVDEGLAQAASIGVEVMLFDCPDGYRQYHVKPDLLPDDDSVSLSANPLLPETDRFARMPGVTIVIDVDVYSLTDQRFLSVLTSNLLHRGANAEFVVPQSQGGKRAAYVELAGRGISFSYIEEFDDKTPHNRRQTGVEAISNAKFRCVLSRLPSAVITNDETTLALLKVRKPNLPAFIESARAEILAYFGYHDWTD